MEHLRILNDQKHKNGTDGNSLAIKASGQYFTPEVIGRKLVQDVLHAFHKSSKPSLQVVDPFCGDGRLVAWLMEEAAAASPQLLDSQWNVSLWDISPQNVKAAKQMIEAVAHRLSVSVAMDVRTCDAFAEAYHPERQFDMVVTNPPWEGLKPDRRELEQLDEESASRYIHTLKLTATRLAQHFPNSAPSKFFSGWGINLSRVGLVASLELLDPHGVCGIVMPASFLADQLSTQLRRWLFEQYECTVLSFYPAEARLFKGVDQAPSTLVLRRRSSDCKTILKSYDAELNLGNTIELDVRAIWMKAIDYCIPVSLSMEQLAILQMLQRNGRVADMEGTDSGQIWLGRELDETGFQRFVQREGVHQFLKGRDIERYSLREISDPGFIDVTKFSSLPQSIRFNRLVWRDVSRPNQKRRLQATLIPSGPVTGNSLGVMHDWQQHSESLHWWLAVISSFPFEFQVRALLRTGHISAGVMRRVALPEIQTPEVRNRIIDLVRRRVGGDYSVEPLIEVLVAKCYGLDRDTFAEMIRVFPKLNNDERAELTGKDIWREILV